MKKCIFFFLLFFLPFSLQAEKLELEAETLYFSLQGGSLWGKGKVNISYPGVKAQGDEFSLHLPTREGKIWGEVEFQMGERKVKARRAEFNLKEKKATFSFVEGEEESLIYRARKAKFSPQRLELKEAEFTTCDLPSPHYLIEAKEVEVFLGDFLVVKNATLRIGKIPLFWTPLFIRYFHRENRPMFPRIGYSDNFGWWVKSGYYFYASSSLSGTLRVDWREKKGWAKGIDFSRETKKGKGEWSFYWLKEKDTHQRRWRIRGKEKFPLPGGFKFKMRLHRLSEEKFWEEYFYQEYKKERKILPSYLSLEKSFPSFHLRLLSLPKLNSFDEVEERLPSLKGELFPTPLSPTPLYLRGGFEWVRFREKNVNREDLEGEIILPLSFSWLSFLPRVGYQRFEYQKDGESFYRWIGYGGVSLSFRLLGKGKKFSHLLIPTIDYTNSWGEESSFPFSLEDEKEEEILHPRGLLRVRLSNYLFRKEEKMRFELKGGYSFPAQNLLPVEGKGRISFSPPLKSISFYGLYEPEEKKIKISKISFNSGEKNWGLALSFRHYEEEKFSDLLLQGKIKFPRWGFSSRLRYDLKKKAPVEERYSLSRNLHCWGVRFEWEREPTPQYWINFYLLAFPSRGGGKFFEKR